MVSFLDVYQRLHQHFGAQHWWPGESPFEVMVGAVLTQNTAWRNVEAALDNLREAAALEPHALDQMSEEELAGLIRPAGYYRLKAKRLRNMVRWLCQTCDGDLDRLWGMGPSPLREQLLQVNGIGPETADSIVLYAAGYPSFVIDAYTARVFKRHGWIDMDAGYEEMQQVFHDALPQDADLFNEYHALIVRVGKEFCGRRPDCERCPLREWLPEGGPLEPLPLW